MRLAAHCATRWPSRAAAAREVDMEEDTIDLDPGRGGAVMYRYVVAGGRGMRRGHRWWGGWACRAPWRSSVGRRRCGAGCAVARNERAARARQRTSCAPAEPLLAGVRRRLAAQDPAPSTLSPAPAHLFPGSSDWPPAKQIHHKRAMDYGYASNILSSMQMKQPLPLPKLS